MKQIIGFMAVLLPLLSWAQSPPVKALSIGDAVPDITITNVYNYPSSTIRLSDLRGKMVILDFWATWCGSCIQTFPEMHDITKEFGDKLQIIMVNSYYPDSISKVKSFLDRRKKRTGLPFELTYALQDTILVNMFPYKQIPHDVWINGEGDIVAITGADQLNSTNIKEFLKQGTINLPLKDDNLLFNPQFPLLAGENGSKDPSFLYRSVITGYKKHLGTSIGQTINSDGKISRVYVINYPLVSLLQKAYPEVFSVPLNRMIIEADSAIKNLIVNPNAPRFCYDLNTAPSTPDEIKTFEQEDLFRMFHLSARNEIRDVDCYTLKISDSGKIKKGKNAAPGMDAEPETEHKFLRNQPVSSLTLLLERLLNKPVANETDYEGNIDLEIPHNIYNISVPRIIAFLESNGFELKPARRKMKAILVVQK
jgi:thiol-disulfide isomerase/thioredoxin